MNGSQKEYSMIMKKFFDLLGKNRVLTLQTEGEMKKATHYSLGDPKGKYDFSGDKNQKLLDIYTKAVFEKNVSNDVYLVETHLPQGPIVIDIDISYSSDKKESAHKYTSSHIERLLEIYNRNIRKYLNVEDPDDFRSYLLEKPSPSVKKIVQDDNGNNIYDLKDGVHIIYPYLCTTTYCQYLIRQNVINEMKATSSWIDLLEDNDLNEVIDKAVIEKNGWLMYGSSKPSFEKNKYSLSKIYNEDLTFVDATELTSVDMNDLPKVLSIRKFSSDDLSPLNSGHSWEEFQIEYQTLLFGKKKSVPIAVIENDIRIAKRLVSLLSDKRGNAYETWLSVGFCLHNINDSLLDTWIEYSQRNPSKYKEGDCEKRWKKFKEDGGLTIRSLHRWAIQDNPSGYSDFMMEELNNVMKRALTHTSYDVAKAFYELYKYNYICSSIKNESWYEFKNHRWISIEKGFPLYNKLNEDFFNEYTKMAQIFYNKAMSSPEEKEGFLEKQTKALNLALKLRDSSYKKKIMEELIKLYYDPEFLNMADEKRHLICFNNGVYDLENDLFREGCPEDYITLCTKIDYKPYNPNDEYVKKVEDFMASILPDVDVKNYTLDLMASCLQGHIPDEKFHIWTGTGGNGKSLSINLLQQALGEYACTLPIAMLTGKRATATSANPELAKTKGKRFAVFQEPEKGDKIHVGHMKELTSNNDKISARSLFKEPVEFFPQFKLLLTCNDKPEIDANDGGTWRRLRVVPFEMKFVDNPKEPNERKINRKIKEELPFWKDALMSILIKRFANYKKNGLTEPSKVTDFTAEYQKDSDAYFEFIQTYLQKSDDMNDSLHVKNLFAIFKFWYKDESNKASPSGKEFRKQLFEKIKTTSGDYIKGYKLKEQPEHLLPPNFKFEDNNNVLDD